MAKEICKTLKEAKEKWEEVPLGRCENIIGQKRNHLTIIYRTKNPDDKHIEFVAQCDCKEGNYIKVRKEGWKNGRTQSCGCQFFQARNNQIKMIPKGSKYGKLTVLELLDKRDHGTVYKCLCDCGQEFEVRRDQLIDGSVKSCGCSRKDVLFQKLKEKVKEGDKFGRLTIIQILTEQDKYGKHYALCKCECGTYKKILISALLSGHTQSCGCLSSKGEFKISQILNENNISFEREKMFDTCIFDTNYPARFDFYVDNKYIIEYDGIQHFQEGGWTTKDRLIKTQEYDNFKNEWCKKNHISLIRIPYTHYNDLCLEDLLLETSNFIVIGKDKT